MWPFKKQLSPEITFAVTEYLRKVYRVWPDRGWEDLYVNLKGFLLPREVRAGLGRVYGEPDDHAEKIEPLGDETAQGLDGPKCISACEAYLVELESLRQVRTPYGQLPKDVGQFVEWIEVLPPDVANHIEQLIEALRDGAYEKIATLFYVPERFMIEGSYGLAGLIVKYLPRDDKAWAWGRSYLDRAHFQED